MIRTITLNPALDLSLAVKSLLPNEKNYVVAELWSPGGNGINAARMADRLGAAVVATGFAGAETGDRLLGLLKDEGLHQNFVRIRGETRINITVSNAQDHNQTRLSLRGPRIRATEWAKLRRQLLAAPAGDLLIFGGSLPPGVTVARLAKLLRELHRKNRPFILDVPGAHLSSLARTGPLLLKPNLTELQEALGASPRTIPQIIRLVRKHWSSVPLVCVSSVEEGALLMTRDRAWFGSLPAIRLRSTVGAGDSMVGAMARELIRDARLLKMDIGRRDVFDGVAPALLRAGLAAAGATLLSPGTELGHPRVYRNLIGKIRIMEVAPE